MSVVATDHLPQSRSKTSIPFVVMGLMGPIILINAIAFIVPMLNLLRISFMEASATGSIGDAVTVQNWIGIVTDSFYLEALFRSLQLSVLVTFFALICSYPIALYLHRSTGIWRTVLTILVISPLLISAVVRTFGWIAILSDQGLLKNMLLSVGIEAPRLIFNFWGVVIGLTEIMMPYMILALLAGFGRLDPFYEQAARTLGASPLKVLFRIVIPLTFPGIALGCLLTFVQTVSSFVTPQVLGGGRVFLLATEIYDQAIVTLNWPAAATLSIIVLVVFGAALFLYARIIRVME